MARNGSRQLHFSSRDDGSGCWRQFLRARARRGNAAANWPYCSGQGTITSVGALLGGAICTMALLALNGFIQSQKQDDMQCKEREVVGEISSLPPTSLRKEYQKASL